MSDASDRAVPETPTMPPTRGPVTLARPAIGRGAASSFPSDLFEQARGRVRLLASFFIAAFLFDLVIFVGVMGFARSVPREAVRAPELQWVNVGAMLLSAGLWWAAKSPRVSAARLHSLGLVYEIVLCFVAASMTYRQFYLDTGILPNLTWVPAIVIMFPLIMPGPPRRMVLAAIASAATAPLAMLLLDLAGLIDTGDGSAYAPAVVGSAFAVGFAYLGARVIYGLGREVARARAMGSYELEEKLGQGGMGEVWRARHQLLARPAAIKLIRAARPGDAGASVSGEALHRFEREAQVIAGLRSPHTVDLFDFGVAADGTFYYAMELLDGLDTDALVRRFGPVPAGRVVFILQQVCHSLAEAEARGLVHRDIKPANIFLCRYGEDHDFVKVLDFGIVKSHRYAGGGDTALTGKNVIHGTPAFMAPEQALGTGEIDARADIYSLGCVAYWLLTGRLVFTADTPTALLLQHIQTPPTPPSAVSELPVPESLDRLILACLEKDPARRPQSARELANRLAEIDVGEVWTEQRGREWWNRHQPPRAS